MMKTIHILALLPFISMVLYGCTFSHAGENQSVKGGKERLEISFNFHRGGIASSQYAIWIEDGKGKLVRTIYATPFTVKGGYEYREDAIPMWVDKAKPQRMTSTQVDAVTGATPHPKTDIWFTGGMERMIKERVFLLGNMKFLLKVRCIGKAAFCIQVILSGVKTIKAPSPLKWSISTVHQPMRT